MNSPPHRSVSGPVGHHRRPFLVPSRDRLYIYNQVRVRETGRTWFSATAIPLLKITSKTSWEKIWLARPKIRMPSTPGENS